MSDNYLSDVKLNENPDGTVSFATEVVATIAGLAANEVDGVASMSAPSAGFADMFSRKEKRNYTKGVRIDLDGNKVTVDVSIVVDYGSPVPDVARNIQENIKKAIETMSGLDVHSVDVHVTGISFEREQRANAELDEQQRKMLEKTEEAEPKAEKAEEAPAAPVAEETPVAAEEPEEASEEAAVEPEAEPEDAADAQEDIDDQPEEQVEGEPEDNEVIEIQPVIDREPEADMPETDLMEEEYAAEAEEEPEEADKTEQSVE